LETAPRTSRSAPRRLTTPPSMARLVSVGERMRTLDLLVRDHKIAPGWADALRCVAPEIDGKIEACLSRLAAAGPYLPTENVIWRAFEVPPAGIRVLILGQDPYPNPNHAVGLSFSTGPQGPVPASLHNIYCELRRSGYEPPGHGDLSALGGPGRHAPESRADLAARPNDATTSALSVVGAHRHYNDEGNRDRGREAPHRRDVVGSPSSPDAQVPWAQRAVRDEPPSAAIGQSYGWGRAAVPLLAPLRQGQRVVRSLRGSRCRLDAR